MPTITIRYKDDLSIEDVSCDPPLPLPVAIGVLETSKLALCRPIFQPPRQVQPAPASALKLLEK